MIDGTQFVYSQFERNLLPKIKVDSNFLVFSPFLHRTGKFQFRKQVVYQLPKRVQIDSDSLEFA